MKKTERKNKMKKIISLITSMILIVVMSFVFVACGSSESTGADDSATVDNSQTTEESTQKTIEEDWIENYYVDEFNEPTDERYITNKELIAGVFSNSATTDSDLLVQFAIDEEYIGIFLYEYGRSLVKNSSSYNNDKYTITLRDESGNEKSIKGTIYKGDDRIILGGQERAIFIDYLCGEEDFKVYIVEDERQITNYLFKVSPSNFAEVY